MKSLIAYPILHFGSDESVAALVIDTNVTDQFKEEDRAALEIFMKEFAARLNLEAFILEILR